MFAHYILPIRVKTYALLTRVHDVEIPSNRRVTTACDICTKTVRTYSAMTVYRMETWIGDQRKGIKDPSKYICASCVQRDPNHMFTDKRSESSTSTLYMLPRKKAGLFRLSPAESGRDDIYTEGYCASCDRELWQVAVGRLLEDSLPFAAPNSQLYCVQCVSPYVRDPGQFMRMINVMRRIA
jgi:hypothetical protein